MMWLFFSVIVVSASVVYLARRAEPFIKRWQDTLIQKHEAAVTIVANPPMKEDEPMPLDLINIAMREGEEWARQGVLSSMQEMYDRCKDWGVVRAAYDIRPDIQ